jgi:hypothetical protein
MMSWPGVLATGAADVAAVEARIGRSAVKPLDLAGLPRAGLEPEPAVMSGSLGGAGGCDVPFGVFTARERAET